MYKSRLYYTIKHSKKKTICHISLPSIFSHYIIFEMRLYFYNNSNTNNLVISKQHFGLILNKGLHGFRKFMSSNVFEGNLCIDQM